MSLVAKITGLLSRLSRSFVLRLTLLLSVLFALGMAATIAVALNLGRDAIVNRADVTLGALGASLKAGEEVDETETVIARPLSDLGDLPTAFAHDIEDGSGTILLEDDYREFEAWRVSIVQTSAGISTLLAVPLDASDDALDLLEGILWAVAVVVVSIAITIGIGAGLLAERRLSQITRTLTRLASGDLEARTGVNRKTDDLDDLAQRLDETAAELERLVTQTRHLSASLAHDLRTPLARLRSRLEMLPEGEARGEALEEAARLSQIFDTIMRIARIEATQGAVGLDSVDLAELADEVAEMFEPVVEDAGKVLLLESEDASTVRADRQMLIQAMANLIQNALLHGGEKIVIFANGAEFGVRDDGPGVDSAQFDEIIKPMVRLDTARHTEGTGLGLALIRAVADRHGAKLGLSHNQPSGLCVTFSFAEL